MLARAFRSLVNGAAGAFLIECLRAHAALPAGYRTSAGNVRFKGLSTPIGLPESSDAIAKPSSLTALIVSAP
jgi:hypothetical protein